MAIGRGDSAAATSGSSPSGWRSSSSASDDQAVHERQGGALERQRPPAQVGAAGAARDPDVGGGLRPKALGVAGRVGDGVVIQLADPEIIQWIMGTARAAEEAGRDPSELECIVCAPSHVGPIEDGREQTRWFPAMVSNHVKDLIERYGTDGSVVPKALTDYVEARKFYDYDEHRGSARSTASSSRTRSATGSRSSATSSRSRRSSVSSRRSASTTTRSTS